MIRSILAATLITIFANNAYSQWEPTSGPKESGGGVMAALGDTIIASSDSGFVRSTDNGMSWVHLDTTTLKTANCLLFEGATLYAGSRGVFRSTDFGDHWSMLGFADTFVRQLIVYEGDLYAAAGDVFRSSDHGAYWVSTNFPNTANLMTVFANRLYAGGSNGLFYTTDRGQTWNAIGPGGSENTIAAFKNDLLMGSGRGLEYSPDSGQSWGQPRPFQEWFSVYSIATTDRYAYAANGVSVFRAKDVSVPWASTLLPEAYFVLAASNAVFVSGGTIASSSNDGGGVYRSTDDGDTWTAVFGTHPRAIAHLSASESNLFACTDRTHEIFRSSDFGDHWTGTTLRPVQHIGTDGSQLFASLTNYNGRDTECFYRSTDQGITWIGAADSTLGTFAYDFVHTRNALLAITNKGVVRSLDNGTTWTLNIQAPVEGNWTLTASDTTLFLGTTTQGTNYRSTDDGKTWTNIGLYNQQVQAFARTPRYTFAAGGSRIFRNAGSDTNWIRADTGLHFSMTISLASYGNILFAGADSDIYITTDDGGKWTSCGTGMKSVIVREIVIKGNYLFAATSNGVWRRPLSDFGIQADVHEPLQPAITLQVYPNPVTTSAAIDLTPQVAGYADIRVVNMLGAEVARIFSGELDASEHTFAWDASKSQVPPGMYEVVVRMNGKTQAVPVSVE